MHVKLNEVTMHAKGKQDRYGKKYKLFTIL